jgi:hypothetical protein
MAAPPPPPPPGAAPRAPHPPPPSGGRGGLLKWLALGAVAAGMFPRSVLLFLSNFFPFHPVSSFLVMTGLFIRSEIIAFLGLRLICLQEDTISIPRAVTQAMLVAEPKQTLAALVKRPSTAQNV